MKLMEHIYLIGSGLQGFGMTDDYDCHIYLVDGGEELAIIDAGAGLGVPQILQNIRDHGFDLAQVRHVLLTHAHADHAGGAAKLVKALGNPRVYMHAACARFLQEGDEEAITLAKAKEVGLYPPDYRFEPCQVDVELREGQRVKIGALELETIETPGHSQGHVSFLLSCNGKTILFGGDLVFFGGKILLQNTWDCDLRAHLDSLSKLRNAEIDALLPGHLTISLSKGQRHIDAALNIVDGLLVPPNFTYGW
ncbi:MAG: MBL fold metallo-hydrolase [Chloroflexi bacterium]|nr:MBL fold metallo-hydrolase [Chloroflexota bacterium]